jgi:parvulin-like peptidyl-prolyl isomerase
LVKKLVDREVVSLITITPAEIAEYFAAQAESFREPEAVRLRDIFLAQSSDEETLQTKIREIYAQLQRGVPFGELVERYSEDQNVISSGDMGIIRKGTLRAEIDSVVFNTAPGTVTPPVKTPNGYYIFKVESRQESRIPPLEKIQPVIRRRLFDEKMRVRMDQWIEQLKNQSFIEVKNHETKEKS